MKVLVSCSFLMLAFSAHLSRGYQFCKCGEERIMTRVIGGSHAKPHRYPWMVGVRGGSGYCGGTLINDRYVLTAAHCVNPKKTPRIVLGAHTRADLRKGRRENVLRVIVHPDYRGTHGIVPGDIALVKLARPVNFTDRVSPICLAGDQEDEPNNLFLVGWGLTVPKSKRVGTQLNEVDLPSVSDERCNWAMGADPWLQICAGMSGRAACHGDSGGPLSTRQGGRVYEIGIVSWGVRDCGDSEGHPAVFTRVTGYLNWILDNTRDAQYCD